MSLSDSCVTVLTADWPSEKSPSAGAFVTTLWSEVTRNGGTVNVIAPSPFGANVARDGMLNGINFSRPAFFTPGASAPFYQGRRNFSHARWIAAATRAAARGPVPDAFFGQFLHPAGQAAARLGERHSRPSFVELSEDTPERWTLSQSESQVAALLQRFAGLILVSEHVKELVIERFGIHPERVFTSYNGVDPSVFTPGDRALARKRLGLPKDAFITVTVARLVDEKGIPELDAALTMQPELFGVFVGTGPQLPKSSNTRICGAVTHHEVAAYLQAANAFALPSRAEGCSNAVLEAMSTGLPLIVSDHYFMREIADEDCAIFVNERDPSDIVRALKRLQEQPDLANAMGAAAVARSQRFTIHQRAVSLIEWMTSR